MPRAPNLRSQSKGAVTNVVEAAKELSTNLHAANMAKLLDEGDNNVLMPHLAKYLHSFDVLFSSSGRIALNATQLSDLTHGLLEADIPHSLLDCLKTITPLSLIAPAWCSDPSCGDGQCGPPSSTPIILMVLNQTLSVVSQAPDEARDLFFKTLVDAGLAPALLDLVDAASTAIRVGPRDIMAVIGSDHALATVLDALSFLRIWIQRHGHEEIEDGSTHYCIDLLIQMEAIQIVPRAIALHETLTKVILQLISLTLHVTSPSLSGHWPIPWHHQPQDHGDRRVHPSARRSLCNVWPKLPRDRNRSPLLLPVPRRNTPCHCPQCTQDGRKGPPICIHPRA